MGSIKTIILFLFFVNISYSQVYKIPVPNVRFGSGVPVAMSTDKENDTYIRTDDGLYTGTFLEEYVFDKNYGAWILCTLPSSTSGISSLTTDYVDGVLTTTIDGLFYDTAQIPTTTLGVTTNDIITNGNIISSTVNGILDTTLAIRTNSLGISGNILTGSVNGVSDTSLIIGTNNVNLLGNSITSNVNGVTDTSLIIGQVNGNLSGNSITLNVNNVTDTVLVIGSNSLSSSVNTMTSNVNGISSNGNIINTNVANLSGNTITSTLNGVSDTTLVVGTNVINLSGSILTSTINGISDTAIISSIVPATTNTLSLSGNVLTSNVNGTSDTSLVIGSVGNTSSVNNLSTTVNGITGSNVSIINSNVANLAGNTLTSTLNGVSDTSLIIGTHTVNLSGNQITSNTNGITDTTLVIGTVSNTSSANSLSTSVNGVTGSNVNIINSNSNSISGNTFTGSVNGISDTSLIIGTHILGLSGNTMTTNTNGITDTSLVIGTNVISYSGSILTSTVNGVTDTALISVSGGGSISIITPSQITSDQNNYNPTGFDAATIVRISGDNGIRAITSLAAQTDGEQKTFINVGDYPIYFSGEDSSATAANRLSTNRDVFLYPLESAILIYDGTTSRWIINKINNSENAKEITHITSFGSTTLADYENLAFAVIGTGIVSSSAANSTSFGGLSLHNNTSSTSGAYIYHAKTISTISYFGSAHIYTQSNIIFPTLSDGSQTYTYECILTASPTSASVSANNSCGIRYSSGINSGNFQGYTRSSTGAETVVDLGVTVAATTPYTLRVEINKARNTVRFYINGKAKGLVTGNMPSAGVMAARNAILKSVGTSLRNVVIQTMTSGAIYP